MKKEFLQPLVQLLVAGAICILPVFGQTTKLPALAEAQRELKGGETHSYRIELEAGQFLHARVEQENIDLVTAVYGPDGKQITESDSPNDRFGPEPILLVASTSGEHRVDIRSPSRSAPAGRYQIEIIALRQASETDKAYAAAQLAFDEARKIRAQQTVESRRAALEKYKNALSLFEVAGDSYRRALTLLSIGITHYQLNEIRKALEYFNETLDVAISLGNRRLQVGAGSFAGGMLDLLGDVGRALDHYHRNLKLARENGFLSSEAISLSNIGKIYNDVADWQRALEFYNQALPVFRSLSNAQSEALTLNNMGIAYYELGELEKGLEYLQQALPLLRAVGNKNSEAYTLLNIGRVYRRSGELQKALAHFNLAQAIQQQIGNRAQEAETFDDIGIAYTALGQYEEALVYHNRALAILKSAGNVRREAMALKNLGEVYTLLGQPEEAIKQFTQALIIFRGIGDLGYAATTLEGVARAERQLGNLDSAHKNIAESLSLIETVRSRSGSLHLRASYRALVEKAYEFYIDLLMERHSRNASAGFDAEALKASERGRARSLLEKLSEAPIDIRQEIDAALIEKERHLKREINAKAQREMQLKARKANTEEIATAQKEISALEDEYQQVQAAIRKSSPHYAALTQPQPLGLEEIQQQLDPETVLLEYSLGDQQSYLWVVASDSLKTYRLPKRKEIQSVADQVYQSLTTRAEFKSLETPAQRQVRIAQAETRFERAAAELSRMILAPAAAELKGKRLVVVADGVLQYVPFAALSSQARYRPLVLDHEIISLPSASAFAVHRQNLRDRKPAPLSIAVVADPVFSTNDARVQATARVKEPKQPSATRIIEHTGESGSAQLTIPRLPFTKREAEQILSIAPDGENLKALGFQANRNVATGGELSKYRYVHFATHGYLDTKRAGLSAIVLSLVDEEGRPQDGFLRTHDIYNLNLPAELVVLSACETGLGKDVQGEGLDGITRGFMYAGARRVIVSLWNVNDKATATLMQRLYTEMLKEGKTPAAALRAAQIEMLRTRQWQSPYFWAAFVMQGEWR